MVKKPKKSKPKKVDEKKPKWLCPECGMLTEGNSVHKTAVGDDCYMVLGRRGWRQLGVYDE